jgi:phosphoribosylaminoimidazole-succinocarboxamide synthase
MTAYQLGPLLYEGKAKRVHATDQPEVVAVEYKDDATAFNALKKASLAGKGALNCEISALLFEALDQAGVPTHYLGLGDGGLGDGGLGGGEQPGTWMLARAVRVIPVEVVIRNVAAGSLCKQLPLEPGTPLDPPLLDLYYKDDAYGDPLLTDARLERLGLLSTDQRQQLEQLAFQVNRVLIPLFHSVGLCLVDFKIELGLTADGQMLVADEISPDTCRLWDEAVSDSQARILDKDRFRQDLGGVVEAYGEVRKRLQGVCPQPRVYR